MYYGYLALGGNTLDDVPQFELINNQRLMANIHWWNLKAASPFLDVDTCIDTISNCDPCGGIERYVSDRGMLWFDRRGYWGVERSPTPSPWWSPSHPATEKFLGVMGLSVSNTEDSMRSATVRQSISHGVVISPLRYKPREMVVLALAVAVDMEGMSEGLAFLRCHYEGAGAEQCGGGENLWFLDVCPDCAEDYVVPFSQTPPAAMQQTDCYACLDPHVRHFRGARVTSGPIVLQQTELPSGGVIAQVEFTIIVSDPNEYSALVTVFDGPVAGTGTQVATPPAPAPRTLDAIDARLGLTTLVAPVATQLPATWTRYVLPLTGMPDYRLGGAVYSYEVHAAADFDELRVGVLDATNVVDGFEVPFLPNGYDIVVDNHAHEVLVGDSTHVVNRMGFANTYDGSAPYQPDNEVTPHVAGRSLFVDVAGTHNIADLHVTVRAAARGCA
jgi:hypothetical protein